MDTNNIATHIERLPKKEWNKLFALIPIIESTELFSTGGDMIPDKDDPDGYTITPEIEIQLVSDFRAIMEELGLIFEFPWARWKEGRDIFKQGDYQGQDLLTLLKLLNTFVRSDHFSYGAGLASRFEDGTVGRILNEMKKIVDRK